MFFSEAHIKRTRGKGNSDTTGKKTSILLDQIVQICSKVGFVKCDGEKHCNEGSEP